MTERVLFCGSLSTAMSKGYQRFSTLQSIGVDVRGFDVDAYFPTDLVTRVKMRMTGGHFPQRLVERLGRDLRKAAADFRPDILWMEKSWVLTPAVLNALKGEHPALRMLNYQTDNPFGTRRRDRPYWREFLRCLPIYDVAFVIRPGNITEFLDAGARQVSLTRYGFHDSFTPIPPSRISPDCRHDVVFVGTALDRRVKSVRQLLGKHKLPLAVYGSRWNRTIAYRLNRSSFHGETGDRYAEVIGGSKICLGFVSWSNRDEYTERSIDIPACGGFLLAERTPKHQELYEEHREAEFFDNDEECADKIRFYLQHDNLRRNIATAGCRRCRQSQYTMRAVVNDVLKVVSHV